MDEENKEFLTDEKDIDPNQKYIRPNYIETELSSDRKKETRDMVKTLNEFGISQRQKLFLIYFSGLVCSFLLHHFHK